VVPDKEAHYRSIFFAASKSPSEKNEAILQSLLPYLPDPIPFNTLLEDLRRNITTSLQEARLTMLGEIGLDGGARLRWPKSARHLYEEKYPQTAVEDGEGEGGDEEWNRLTPFKVSMHHQKAIVEAQLEVAIELRVNVSFHSVAAPGLSFFPQQWGAMWLIR
jgi:Tat protein secretion system quality control protein TatD with DNase activity